MAVDTLYYVKRLEAVGIERRQAEAHAEALRDTVAPQLATKADLDAAVIRLEHKIDSLGQRFETMLWKHSAAIILAVLAIGGVLVRFVR
jgi:hypothetical protein